jgi:CheY-like chemotaxis protein
LAAGIAHEFNNILVAIMGYAEMALEAAQIGKSDPQDMQRVISSAVRARDLVRRIMTFSRTSTSASKPLCINQAVDQIAKMLLRIMPKHITIQSNLAPDLASINGDAGQLEQILMNLATNAKDTMPGGGRLSIETSNVFLDEGFCRQHLEILPGQYVLLKVSDTGLGMDESSLEHIYDPFYTTKEVGKGTGLGLSIVHGIVKSHGGHIFCQSKPGEGTTFDIYFPAAPNLAPASALQVEPIQEATLDSQFILLVDDEEALRDLGIRILEGAGHKVFTAQSGEDALELYLTRGHQLDLVIMDLGMPGMGGVEALKAIMGINPRAKVLVASGYAAEDQVRGALAEGAAGYIAKPFTKAELLANIKLVLMKD